MSSAVIPRAECMRRARAELDAARAERDADYAAGRLTGERLAAFERLLAERDARQAPAAVAA